MDKFERLNRETRDYNNNRPITRTASNSNSAPKYGTSGFWINYNNNQTYKSNNGCYSNYYSNK